MCSSFTHNRLYCLKDSALAMSNGTSRTFGHGRSTRAGNPLERCKTRPSRRNLGVAMVKVVPRDEGSEVGMARIVRSEDRPLLESTRDTRDRIDLITEDLFDTVEIRADIITYHAGDTAAAHYHADATHYFIVQEGTSLLHAGDESSEVGSGDVVMIPPNEVHWFENTGGQDFSFIELWVPAPVETVWVTDDRCTWAPRKDGSDLPDPNDTAG